MTPSLIVKAFSLRTYPKSGDCLMPISDTVVNIIDVEMVVTEGLHTAFMLAICREVLRTLKLNLLYSTATEVISANLRNII
jgi:hypothetical protein